MKFGASAFLAAGLLAAAAAQAQALSPRRVYHCVVVQAFDPHQPDGTLSARGPSARLVGKSLVFDISSGELRIDEGPARKLRIEWRGPNAIVAQAVAQAAATVLVETLEIRIKKTSPPT